MRYLIIVSLFFVSLNLSSQEVDLKIKLGTKEVKNICLGASANVNVTMEDASQEGGIPFSSWQIEVKEPDGNLLSQNLASNGDDYTFSFTKHGMHSIVYTVDASGSQTYTFRDTFFLHQQPVVDFKYEVDSFSTFRIYYDTTNTVLSEGTKNAYSFNWDFRGDNDFVDTLPKLVWKYDEPGTNADTTYSVRLRVDLVDDNTCSVESAVEYVKVIDILSATDSLIAPNVFTPNGDGTNDYWIVKSNGESLLNVNIYNRNGNQVYQATAQTIAWDGNTERGLECAPGIYYYLIQDEDKNIEARKGFFYLLRE